MIHLVPKSAAALLAGFLLLGLTGCERREPPEVNKGPAERAGKKVDEATVQAGKELNKLMDKAGQQMEKAGEKMQESARKAGASDNNAPASAPAETTSTTTNTTTTTTKESTPNR